MRDRFGITARLEFYSAEELTRIVTRSAGLLQVQIADDGAHEIAPAARAAPRIANRLLRRVRDFAEVRSDGRVSREIADAALSMLDVDHAGLDVMDRNCCRRLSKNSAAARSGWTMWQRRLAKAPTPSKTCWSRI